jgi:ABC-type transport system involved in Fe-S cluster assembly fused permease/ATPase subunit
VIFMQNGRIAGTGMHEELLATQPGYAAIIQAYEDREEVTADDER